MRELFAALVPAWSAAMILLLAWSASSQRGAKGRQGRYFAVLLGHAMAIVLIAGVPAALSSSIGMPLSFRPSVVTIAAIGAGVALGLGSVAILRNRARKSKAL